MSESTSRYQRASFPVLLYCGTSRPAATLIKDGESWEDFNEETVSSYLSEGSAMLIATLQSFVEPDSAYSSLKAKEMRFMLEALIEVKELLAQEHLPTLRRE